jgi:hypothetical protein
VKPFLDPKTFHKVKFVYPNNSESMKHLDGLLLKDKLKDILDNPTDYNHEQYAKLMEQDDMKSTAYWKIGEGQFQNGDLPDPGSMIKLEDSTEVKNQHPKPVLYGETPVLESRLE